MSDIKFSQLPNLGTITTNTIVPVVDAGTNYTVTAANLQTYVNTSSGNVTGGNLLTGGVVSATGNVQGNYILGNGSQLTGLPATYSNANVVSLLAGFGSNVVSTTGNVTAGYLLGNGSQLTGLPATYGNANVVTLLAGFGSNTISTTGNITGAYILGNGSQLSGLPATYGNANVAANLAAFGSNPISTTGNITGSYILGNGSQLTGLPATYSNANVTTLLASFGSNTISTTGNITGNYILGNGSQLSGLPATYGNANVAANLAAFGSNPISTTGNVTASYFAGNGSLLTGVVGIVGNTISSGTNFANTDPGNGRMWINGGNAASGNLDGFAANALFITNGGINGARMVFGPGTDGNVSIQPGNATTGYVSINGVTITNNGNTVARNLVSQTTQSFTFTANAGGFGSTAGFNSIQLTKTGTSSGTAGDIAWDANYIYVCTATNVWKRTALSSF